MTSDLAIAVHASQLRENLGIGSEAVIGDIVQLIKDAEYEYMEDAFGGEFSGFSRSLDGGKYLIGFNTDQLCSEKFRRFTLAHELGHVHIPEHRSFLETGEMHRSKSEYRSDDSMEKEADRFSICFLAPKRAFQEAMMYKDCTKETILYLSDFFGISSYAAVLRFMDLTDLVCTLVVCNDRGFIDYEKRSGPMKEKSKLGFLGKQKVKGTTLTSDYINGKRDEDTCTVSLSEWFDDLSYEVEANESVIELGYNGKFLTLLTPHITDMEEYDRE